MAYTASIAIAVKGIQDVRALQEKIEEAAKGVDRFNNYAKEAFGGDFVRSIRNLNTALRDASEAFDKAALGTSRAVDAARAYIAAEREVNRGLEERKRLLREVAAEEAAVAAASAGMRFSFGGPKALPAAGQTAFKGEVTGGLGGGARALLQDYEMLTGAAGKLAARTQEQADTALRFVQGIKQQLQPLSQIEALYAGISQQAAQMQRIKALPDSTMLNAAGRGIQALETAQDRYNRELQETAQKLQQLDRLEQSRERRARKLQDIADYYGSPSAMENAGFGVQGPAVPPGGIKRKPKAPSGRTAAQLFENLALGAGFPLLFGGGPGQVLGGFAGSFVGTGFGGQILGSAIGGQLEQLGIAATKAGQALQKPIDNFSTIEERALLASSSQERYVKNLIDAGQYIEATAVIQKRYNEVVGAQGSAALVELAQSSDKLNRAWSELNLQIQAALAGPLADLLNWIAGLVQAGADANKEARTQEQIFAGLSPDQQKEFKRREQEILKGANIFNEAEKRRQVAQMARGFGGAQGQATQPMGFRATEVQDTASIERRQEIQAQITQLRQAELAAAQAQLQQDVTILTKQQEFALSLNQQSALIDKIAAKKVESANLEYQQVYRTQQVEVTNAQLALDAAKVQAKVTEEKYKQLQAQRPLTKAEQEQLQSVRENVLVKERGLSTAVAVLGVTLARAKAEYDSKNALVELERRQQNVAAYAADAARQTEAFNRAANEATNALNNRLKVSDALTQAALTVNNIEIQSLQNKLAQAATDGDRLKILDNIRDLEIANAALTLQATRTQIQAEVERQRIAMSMAEMKYKELQATVLMARAQGVIKQEYVEALRAQSSALQIARDNYATSVKVADAQMMAANAVYNASVNAANLRVQMEGTAAAAGAVAGAMDRVATSSGGDGGGGGGGRAGISFGAAEKNAFFMQQYYTALNELNRNANKYTVSAFERASNELNNRFLSLAEGYNKRIAQERKSSSMEEFYGGPSPREAAMEQLRSKMSSSTVMGRSASPQVNITTGPVMQMDGTNYVTQRDLVSATGTAARQGAKMALEMLQNNPASRRSTGVTR